MPERWERRDMQRWPITENTFLEYDFAVVNPIQLDDAGWEDLPNLPIVPGRYQSQAQLFPRLIDLGQLERHARMDLFQRHDALHSLAQVFYFSVLLKSAAPAADVAVHLARQMQQYDAVRRTHDVVRLHDARVLEHLDWMLSDEQWQALLGPIDRLAWPQESPIWTHRETTSLVTTAPARLTFSAEQWPQMLRVSELNQCLARLARLIPTMEKSAGTAQKVDRLLVKALQTHGLRDRADRALFVEQAFQFGEGIHEQQEVRRNLERACEGEASYVGLCADMTTPLRPRTGA
ncbi:hypothetical protein XpopCFBP1817_00840 [Xanthomonas populi]|uniref:Uncharacterized protein n=1 Tax=Xanthomonas populi TaxID=53414 RepID=A0A2S7F4C5_9XANT|nr:hypothetical protein XpopCFBP1817_00840 [Xanthomonas populi]